MDLKGKLERGEEIGPLDLTKEVIEALQIHSTLSNKVCQSLWNQGIRTWGNLTKLSEEKLKTYAGNEEQGGMIWDELEKYRNRRSLEKVLFVDYGLSIPDEALTSLKNKGIQTWGNLLAVKTEEKMIEYAGHEISGGMIWNVLEHYKKQREASAERTKKSKVLSFEELSQDVIGHIKWPENVSSFEPRTFELPVGHPLETSVKEAKVMSSFTKPLEPDFLLTEMSKAISYDEFCSLSIENGSLIQIPGQRNIEAHIALFRTIVMVGTSGAGKSLYTYKLSNASFCMHLVCDTKGNGGTSDVFTVLSNAEELRKRGENSENISMYVLHAIRLIIAFRVHLLQFCKNKYGPAFLPRHWLMLQLYSTHLFGQAAPFQTFLNRALALQLKIGIMNQPLGLIIILDEAQVADQTATGFFPSRKDPGVLRSLLKPIVDALSEFNANLTICGTGLSASSVYEASVSPQKDGVGTTIVGLATYFDANQLKQVLSNWGIPEVSNDNLAKFQGRPRFAERLAKGILKSDILSQENGAIDLLRETLKGFVDIGFQQPQRTPNGVLRVSSSLRYALEEAALSNALGKPTPNLSQHQVTALTHGVCALKLKKKSSTVSCKFVVDEPLFILAAIGRNPGKAMEDAYESASHTLLGDWLEDYLAVKADVFPKAIKLAAESPGNLEASQAFNQPWLFVRTQPWQLARMSHSPEEDCSLLEQALKEQSAAVIFACTRMGPDLIILCWAGETPLVILVQVKSGKSFSTREAFSTLEQLYTENRVVGTQATDSNIATKRFNELLSEHGCRVALVVFKPLQGSQKDYCEVNNSKFVLCIDAINLKSLALELVSGIEILKQRKGLDNDESVARKVRMNELQNLFDQARLNVDATLYSKSVARYLTGNSPEKYNVLWAYKVINQKRNKG